MFDFTAERLPDFPPEAETLLENLAGIGAPTGQERKRADFIRKWFCNIRPGAAKLDEIGNVIVDLSDGETKCWLVDAHTDIVFDDEVLRVKKDGRIWRCPGIYDDTVHCVLLMLAVRELLLTRQEYPFIFTFTVGEEGEGDLLGIKAIVDQFGKRILAACCLDLHIHNLTVAAVGSKRWRIACLGPGGHSWGHFGTPSAIHTLAGWIDRLAHLAPWAPGHLSYNIGHISGGTTINSIAASSECLLDLRCEDPELLESTAQAILDSLKETGRKSHMTIQIEQIGDRPAGIVPPDSPFLHLFSEIHDKLNLPLHLVKNSTNANALIAAGIPATCTGLAHGDKVHTREEWLDITSLPLGWEKLWHILQGMCDM